jgi:hypothetical protein
MNENEARIEEEKRRMEAECGGTYAHRKTTMKRIFFFSSLFFS